MYCNACGGEVAANQSVCGRCGAVVGRPVVSRVEQHLKMLGILWIAYAALHAIGGAVLLIIANTIFGEYGGRHAGFLHPLLQTIGILVLAKCAACAIAGVGLLERESWARTLSLVMAFISLINVPFGTAMGVYTLWVFLSPQADADYRRLSNAPA
jgi:hypothetical protein